MRQTTKTIQTLTTPHLGHLPPTPSTSLPGQSSSTSSEKAKLLHKIPESGRSLTANNGVVFVPKATASKRVNEKASVLGMFFAHLSLLYQMLNFRHLSDNKRSDTKRVTPRPPSVNDSGNHSGLSCTAQERDAANILLTLKNTPSRSATPHQVTCNIIYVN